MARKIIGKETIYKIADLYSSGTSYAKIAKECELSIPTVMKYINKMIDRGELIERERTRLTSSREFRELVDKFVNGATIKRLVEDYNISVSYIYKCINDVEKSAYTSDDYKLKIAKRKRKYTNTYNVDQILKDYMNPNLTVKDIVVKYNICTTTLNTLVSNSGLPKRNHHRTHDRTHDQEFINKVKELYYANKTCKEIGIELGIPIGSTFRYVKKFISLGYIEKREVKQREVKHMTSTRSTYSSSKLYSIAEMYNKGVPILEIVEYTKLSQMTIYRNIKKAKEIGLIPLEKDRLVIRSNKRNAVIEIVRKLYRENKSIKEISNITGLDIRRVYKYTEDFRKDGDRYKRANEEKRLLILNLYQKTKNGMAVSRATGIPAATVYRYINDANSIKYKYQLTNGESGTNSSVK